jgi:hypothetical protein
VFYGLADFRGSEIGHAHFDFVDFRQTTSFVNARFGLGGASFLNAHFGGPLANFDGVASQGPLVLTGAYMPTLRFRWSEIGQPVLASWKRPAARGRGERPAAQAHDIRIPVLEQLWRRLEELGRGEESLKAYYYLADLRRQEALARSDVSLMDKAMVWGEWVLWGLPTGYGTRFGRILLVALISWPVCALPFLLKCTALRVGPTEPSGSRGLPAGEPLWLHEPVYGTELPAGRTYPPVPFFERLRVALSYTFMLLFKIRLRGIRYFEPNRQTMRFYFRAYLFIVWMLGAIYLALLGLTLATTSPALSKLIGKIAFR